MIFLLVLPHLLQIANFKVMSVIPYAFYPYSFFKVLSLCSDLDYT